MATTITIKNLTKKFGKVTAVNNVSLTIEPGSFLTLLGPSGCGKTTLLRSISGLEDPDDGEIYIGDKLVFSKPKGRICCSRPTRIGTGLSKLCALAAYDSL